MKDNFVYIDYESSIEIFQKAELTGKRLKMGDLRTASWLQKEKINIDVIKDISRNYPDMRIFIIGEGENEGFYIYSKKHETCFKFEHSFSDVKNGQ